jgi:hypothetical protein
VWKFRVVDASLVPREYCEPDPLKIKRAGPSVQVPGVEWYEESEIVVRRA